LFLLDLADDGSIADSAGETDHTYSIIERESVSQFWDGVRCGRVEVSLCESCSRDCLEDDCMCLDIDEGQ